MALHLSSDLRICACFEGASYFGSLAGEMKPYTSSTRAPRVGDLGAVALIAAPFIGPGGWQSDEMEASADLAARLPVEVPVFVYHGENDAVVPVAHAKCYGGRSSVMLSRFTRGPYIGRCPPASREPSRVVPPVPSCAREQVRH